MSESKMTAEESLRQVLATIAEECCQETLVRCDGYVFRCVREMRAERDQLKARVAEIEAPPVVPEGWSVVRRRFVRDHWEICSPGDDVGRWFLMHLAHADKLIVAEQDSAGICTLWHVPNVPLDALRALAWAIEHDQRPPHAGDEP